ncbi:MAG: glycosyltransferase family 9 protein [Gammaproteobacteria bacterium]|nr:glycosyltransferase family 9 protein [Gammaproteobacteria bacterium]
MDKSEPRLLFVTLSNIGDLVLTTPTLEALHRAWPEHLIDIVADARSSDLLRACPYLGTLYHRDKRAGMAGTLKLIAALRARRYTAVVDLRTDFLPWLLRADARSARWRRGAHGPHAAEQHFAVAARILPSPADIPAARIWITPEDAEFATQVLISLPGPRLLAIAPGANWPGKIWPVSHFEALLERTAGLFSGVILLGSRQDRAITAALKETSPLPALDLAGSTTLRQAAALLDATSVFVGNDSGLGHLAAARGIPSITLIGPGRPERYRPWGPQARLLEAPQRQLPLLLPETVATALHEILA